MSITGEDNTSRLAPSFLPSTAVLEMTYRCNHRCTFCSCPWEASGDEFPQREELSLDAWKRAICRLAEMGVCKFAFTGGEPLLKEGLTTLLEYAGTLLVEKVETVDGVLQSRTGSPELYLLSNGSAVDDVVLAHCRRGNVQLSMSLPGLATYRKHTQYGSPDTVLNWFREAAARGVRTVVSVTVTRKNLHELYDTIAAAFLAGANRLLLNRFLPGGRGLEHTSELLLDRTLVRQMLDTAEQALRDANRRGSVGTELPRCVADPSKYERLDVGTRCAAAHQFFVVGPSGYVRTCNHSPRRLAHIDAIETVQSDPYWMRFVRRDYLPDACGDCHLGGECDAGCREAAHITGSAIDALDPLMNYRIEERNHEIRQHDCSGAASHRETLGSCRDSSTALWRET